MSERTYVVGLPVIITINEDGTVTYEVDISEAASGIREDDLVGGSGYDDAQREADSRIIEADPDRPKVTHTLPEADDVAVTAVCRFCGRGIGFNESEGWVNPEATGDDYIWRVTCEDNHEDRIAAHEPTEEKTLSICHYCKQPVHREGRLLVDMRTGDWWCRKNPSNGGDAAPHEEAEPVVQSLEDRIAHPRGTDGWVDGVAQFWDSNSRTWMAL